MPGHPTGPAGPVGTPPGAAGASRLMLRGRGAPLVHPLPAAGQDVEEPRTGVDGVVVAEIPLLEEDVAAHLAAEQRARLAHLGLEQRVTGLPHDAAPAVPGDVVVETLRALHLGDDHRARVARQHVAPEEHEELVAPDDAPLRSPAGLELAGLEAPAQVLDLPAVQRLLAEAELEAVVVGRVVAAGHLDAAVQVPVEEREVHERRGADADVEHADAGRRDARGDRGRVGIGGEAAVAADGHHAPARLGGEGAEGLAQAAREVGVEVLLGDAADVVLAEDGGIQSRTSTWWRSRRSCESQFWKRSSSAWL